MSLDQRIVYAGLSRMTQNRSVIQNAFQYWQANLSNQAFDVVAVTSAFEEYLGLDAKEKKVLMISLHAASNKSESELAPVPGFITQTGDNVPLNEKEPEPEVKSLPPHVHVTSQFVQLLAATTKKVDAAGYREIDEILQDEGLLELDNAANKLVKRAGFGSDMLPESASADDCRELAHQLYLLIIDVIGPVQADVAVNQVIDQLLGSDMASRFDPRTLI